MRFPTQKQKPRRAKVTSFAAPTGGLVSNRNLAMSRGPDMPPGAAVLENMFPTATGVVVRRGSVRWATLDEQVPVKSLFTYISGAQRELFCANSNGIWNITSVPSPYSWALGTGVDEEAISPDPASELAFGSISVNGLDVLTGVTDGDWSVVQFATAGGEFLVGVNGVDDGFLYDGADFYPLVAGGIEGLDFDAETAAFTVGETLTGGTSGATAEIVKVISDGSAGTLWLKTVAGGPFQNDETITDGATGSATADGANTVLSSGITFPSGSSLTTADLSYVWVYKQRVWFIEKDSLNAWYLPVDQVGGELTLWPMGGVFVRGGNLLWGHSWSLDSGGSGGLSEQCAFCTTEGEVAAYQGLSPEPDQGWSKVGVYRIGRPMGKKAMLRAGGDLVIATTVGLISLAMASRHDYAALGQNAVSYDIEDDWADAIRDRGIVDWRCQVWADGQMVLVAPPVQDGKIPYIFVANANTGKWAKFTGWDVSSIEAFDGRLFFGTSTGTVCQGWAGGADEGAPFIGRALPLFENLNEPAGVKIMKMARAVVRSAYPIEAQVSGHVNYRPNFPPAPSVSDQITGNEWENAVWDVAVWDSDQTEVVAGNWVSVGGSGHDVSVGVQFTSGGLAPVDAELIRIDMTYTTGGVGT